MNVTPLIDVLLVLLIIFMVITPTQSLGLRAEAPQPAADIVPRGAVDPNVVVQVTAENGLIINAEPVEWARLGERLLEIFATRADRVVFVKAAGETEFQLVASVVDIAKSAGITRIGLLGLEH